MDTQTQDQADEFASQVQPFEFTLEYAPPPVQTAAPPEVPPEVRVYTDEDVDALAASLDTRDRETKDRLEVVISRLRQRGGIRPLAILPANWKTWLASFEADFPNFQDFTALLRSQFALSCMGDGRIALPPILFDGPPGVGKTEVALRLAEWLNTDSRVIDMASTQTGSALTGSDAFWSNSREGGVFEMLVFGETANPLIFLDELDKVSGEDRFRPDAGLFQLLESRTAAGFRDQSIREIRLDARHILWFAATNEVGRMDPAIRSRFLVIPVAAPDRDQSIHIAQAIYRHLLSAQHWGPFMAPRLSQAVAERAAEYAPRTMRVNLLAACGNAALDGRREVTVQDLVKRAPTRTAGIGFVR